MVKKYILSTYLYFYQLFIFLWNIIFAINGPIYMVYHIDSGDMRNITFFYYVYCLSKYRKGLYYCQILNRNRVDHITFEGDIDHIKKIELLDEHPYRKRKNITLIKNDHVIHFDLNLLDNYVHNMQHNKKPLLTPREILKYLGVECTHVDFVEFFPFRKIRRDIDELTLIDFYDD